ncbi:MAG TPA: hypothetical protein PLS93_13405 [Accumulibacter sp.]|nr:hypothetical protein [Accumulibacter sp.]
MKPSDQLRRRAVAAAEKQGVSPRAFMAHAIEQAATLAEPRSSFVSEAQAARQQMLRTGKGYDASEVHTYLKARIADRSHARPKTTSWRD